MLELGIRTDARARWKHVRMRWITDEGLSTREDLDETW